MAENLEMGVGEFASEASGLLGQIFEDNKAAAIACAMLDTTAGIAQVQKIASTTRSSTSVPGAPAGGSAAPAAAPAGGGTTQAINIHLAPQGNYSGAQVAGLVKSIEDH